MATKYDKSKELRRIRQFFRRAEKRGFSYKSDFDPSSLKDLPAYKLHQLTAEKLYNKLEYRTDENKMLSGKKARGIVESINRKLGAVKAAITRKLKHEKTQNVPQELQSYDDTHYNDAIEEELKYNDLAETIRKNLNDETLLSLESQEEILQKIAEEMEQGLLNRAIKERTENTRNSKEERAKLRDEIDKRTPEEELSDNGFTEEEIELQNLLNRIDAFPSPGADRLKEALDREIDAYGRTAVARSIHEIPEHIKAQVEKVLHYESKSEGRDAIIGFIYLIEGGLVPEMDELKSIGEAQDSYDIADEFDEE